MIKHNYFKVEKNLAKNGSTKYIVYGCTYWLEKLFWLWDEYTKTHDSLGSAVNHIERLKGYKTVSTKTVFKCKV